MEQKVLLINSMQKLINHIVVSKKNQEEIFASLSKNDFKKIISNLEDQNQKLRKISLMLISQLVYNNQPLKEKFCQIMNIPVVPGRIALNTKLCPSSSRTKNTVTVDMTKNIKEVYTLLKQPIMDSEKNGLFWFINFENRKTGGLELEHINATQPQSIQISDLLDPIDSMVGFVLGESGSKSKQENYLGSPMMETRRKSEHEGTKNRFVNNYFKPASFNKNEGLKQVSGNQAILNQSLKVTPGYSTDREIGYVPKTVSSNYKAVSSTIHHQSPYQQANKSMNNPPSPVLHQLRANLEGDQNRNKYGGIKVISTATTAAKGREGGKYFEESPLYQGSVSSGTKNSGLSNGAIFSKVVGRVERGYETLRQKKIGEKKPFE